MKLGYKGIEIFYSDTGSGSAIVLLHGFLENTTMWKYVTPYLAKRNRVICIDLLGHGQTGSLGYSHSMETMAEAVNAVLKELRLLRITLIGHSMGGYVALAFAEKYPKKIKRFCLMNSTFEQDDKERQKLRKRANKMAQTNFKNLVRMSFANLFSKESSKNFKSEINLALDEALKTSVQGYIAANEGMILRKNHKAVFTNLTCKKLLILGEKDWIIPSEEMVIYAERNKIDYALLSQGHMSHIENKAELIDALVKFTRS